MDYLVGARMTDGNIQKFMVSDVGSVEEAREAVRVQVPRTKVVLALVCGPRSVPVDKVAA